MMNNGNKQNMETRKTYYQDNRCSVIVLIISIIIIIAIVLVGIVLGFLLEGTAVKIVLLSLIVLVVIVGIISFAFLQYLSRKAKRNRQQGIRMWVQDYQEEQRLKYNPTAPKNTSETSWALTQTWKYNKDTEKVQNQP